MAIGCDKAKLARLPDWDARLGRYLGSIYAACPTFEYGKHDCARFCGEAIHAMTGVDVMAEWRTRYHDRFTAFRRIAEGGGFERLVEEFMAEWGFDEVPVLTAQRGDIVLVDTADGPAVAVVGPSGAQFYTVGPAGADWRVLRQARRAWRV